MTSPRPGRSSRQVELGRPLGGQLEQRDVGILQAGQASHDRLVTREDMGHGVRIQQVH